MNFWKTLLASLLGSFIAFGLVMLLFVVLMIAAIGGALSSAGAGGGPVAEVKQKSVLHLVIENAVVERGNENEMVLNPISFENTSGIGLDRFTEALRRAGDDARIEGAFIEVKDFLAGPASLRDMHRAISEFKEKGKWLVAYGENYTSAGYYLASVADEVCMHPEGMFDWRGMHAELMFFKNMLEKVGVEMQVIKGPDNKYKSAVEPFINDKMSDANREQLKVLIDDIWSHMLTDIATDRGVMVADLMTMADSLSLYNQQVAVDKGLLSGLKYRDEVISSIFRRLGSSDSLSAGAPASEDDINFITFNEYFRTPRERREGEPADHRKDKVAVVYAVGDITSGEGNDMTIGSDRIARALREAREDDKVKAIVLRVNSPGGSALASDVIWHETRLIRESGKPLVVSMGDYAASGGYYIACAADSIFANASTITGSIGVFAMMPNTQRMWNEKLGITFDRYETNPYADMISITKPLDPREMESMQRMITDIYEGFISRVADGRKMDNALADSLGQGRVWSGEDAIAIRLADAEGNLNDAVACAARMAGMTDYTTKELPELINPLDKLLEELTGQKKTALLRETFGPHYPMISTLQRLMELEGPQARMPFDIILR